MSRPTMPPRHFAALAAGVPPIIGWRRDGRPIRAVMGAGPEEDAAAAAAAADASRAGGQAQLLADLARERDRRQQAEADLAAARAAGSAQQQAQAEAAAEAERQRVASEVAAANARAAAAIARSVMTEAKGVAVAAGVRDERTATFLRLVDLSGVTVADDGTPDVEGIRTLVTAALDDAPEFRTRTAPGERRAERDSGHGAGAPVPADLQAQVAAHLAAMQDYVGIPRPA